MNSKSHRKQNVVSLNSQWTFSQDLGFRKQNFLRNVRKELLQEIASFHYIHKPSHKPYVQQVMIKYCLLSQ